MTQCSKGRCRHSLLPKLKDFHRSLVHHPADSEDERGEWDPAPGQAPDFILGLGVQELVDQGVTPFRRVVRERDRRNSGVDGGLGVMG